MDEQAELWRSHKEFGRDTVRGVREALRFYHNYIEKKEREEELQKREEAEKVRQEFQENFKKPGEKSYDFMLESGRNIDYHTLDDRVDIEKLKGLLDSERLQYCIRTSSLDNNKEIVYFTKDTPRIKAALSKSLEEMLKDTSKQQEKAHTEDLKRLTYSPFEDFGEGVFRDTTIYQGMDAQQRIEMKGFDNIPREKMNVDIALDREVSLVKLKEFFEEYDLKASFYKEDDVTKMALWLKKDKLAEQKASIQEAFFALGKHPERVRQYMPLLEERFDKAKTQHEKMVKAQVD